MYKKIIEFIREIYQTDQFIPLHEPRFLGNEERYILDCLKSTYVSSVGAYVDRFEQMVCEFTGAKYGIATVNGTAALHMALVLAGVKSKELVITQPLTFVATCNAIAYAGAEPVFVDIDTATLGMSPDSLEKFLDQECFIDLEGHTIHRKSQKRIAACVPMHTFGHPVQIDKIFELCKTFNIPLVEDAAESLGSFYKNQHTGTFGLLGILSFNGNKTVTCGGGGMILTNNERLAKLAKHLTTTAKVPHTWEYDHDQIGYNYRLPNLNAALACAQMEQLPRFVENKRELADLYHNFFTDTNITTIKETAFSKANYWLNAILFPDKRERDAFLRYTNKHQVMTRPVWNLMYNLAMFKNCIKFENENANYLKERVVNIPSSVTLSN